MSHDRLFVTNDCWGCHKRLTDQESIQNWAPLFRRDRNGTDILLGDMVWCNVCVPERPKMERRYVQA